MEELRANDVEIYTFPTDDETVAEVNKDMNEMMPFAGSLFFVDVFVVSQDYKKLINCHKNKLLRALIWQFLS